jgi:hypothetical protein
LAIVFRKNENILPQNIAFLILIFSFLQDFGQKSAGQVSASLQNYEKRNSRLLRYYLGVLNK